jgi:hypothetical protein
MYPKCFSCFQPLSWAVAIGLSLAATQTVALETVPSSTVKLEFQSVYAKYQKFEAQDVSNWRNTNDVVEQIGGWRAYAKEVNRPEVADTPDRQAPSTNSKADSGDKP